MQSMDEIYQTYARTVYKYLLSKTRSEDIAEELTSMWCLLPIFSLR